MLILTGPLIPFCKGRLPASEQSTLANIDWKFRKDPLFWIYTISTIIQGFGLFFPALFLASYATDIGLSNKMGALALSVLAMSQFAGQGVFGYTSDKNVLSVETLAIICSVMSGLAALLLWGFGRSLPLLMLFSVVFGFFGYGFSSMRAAMVKQITNDPTTLMALQSILNGSLGWGNILVGPISANLIRGGVSKARYGVSKYEDLVYFTGACMLGSAVLLMVPFTRRLLAKM
jgi:MFS family permease